MKYKLSEMMDIIGGGTPKTSKLEYWNGDIPWLSVKDFNNNYRYVYKTEKTITKAGLNNSSAKMLKRNDSIISARGTVGEMAMIPFPMAFNQSCYGLRAKEDIVNAEYLYYLIKHKVVILKKNTHGSVFDTITRDTFNGIEVDLPSLEEQKKVASILRDYDDKIEVNNEINKNLQEQAQALYSNMFLQNPSKQWTEGILSDIADITMGQSPKGDTYNEEGVGTVFFQGRGEFSFRFPTRRLFTTDPKRMAQSNDVLMSVRAPVGDLNVAYEPCCIGRGLGAIRSKDGHQSFVLYTVFSLREKLDMFNGEGTVFGSINRDALNSMPIVIPTREEMDRFEDVIAPMDAAIRNNYGEICHLEAIRDSLLPRLMSCELDVSDIDL